MKVNSLARPGWHMHIPYKTWYSVYVHRFIMTGNRVKAHLHVLKKLQKCSGKQRKALLAQGGKPLQLCLRECAINILKGNVHLTKSQFKKLQKYKKKLRGLSKKNTSHKKRLLIEQRGGFLPLLLAPIVGSLLSRLLKNIK